MHSKLHPVIYLFLLQLLSFAMPSSAQLQAPIYNELNLPASDYTLKFKWHGDSVNHRFEQHSALLVPVKFKGCPTTFYMQFDLGSPYSMFYSKKITSILRRYPKTDIKINSSKVAAASFRLDRTQLVAKEINLREFGGEISNFNSKDPIIIGTIGVDLIDGKTLVIDYPKRKLTIAANVPSQLASTATTPFVYMQRSILFPAIIRGKKTMLFFDTGSSRYSLLTDEKTAKAMASDASAPMTSKVSSWDRVLTATQLPSASTISIAAHTILLQNVTYMQGASSAQIDMMSKLGIGGMTGNKLFLPYKLIIDTKNKKFGLLE